MTTHGADDARALITALVHQDHRLAHQILNDCEHPWDALHHTAGLFAAFIRAAATEVLDVTPAELVATFLTGCAHEEEVRP